MGRILAAVSVPLSFPSIRHVSPVRRGRARGLVADVYQQVERDFGMLAPPVILHSPAPEVLAASWLILRESLLAAGTVNRAVKEVVATEVSAANTCPYCVDVHKSTLRGLERRDYETELSHPGIRRAAVWARASGSRDTAVQQDLPLPPEHIRELLAVAVTFHYFNRMVNVFLGDSPLPPEMPAGARGPALRVFGWLMRPAARKVMPPGDALGLLPAAPLPDDLSWAAGTPSLAAAFAGATAAIEEAGRRSVPDAVRELVTAELTGWDGRPAGLSRAWAADAVAPLPAAQRPAGRLALLTALASYQVDQAAVAEFRQTEPDERALVELTAWASLSAARRVGSWLPIQPSRA
ncbi:carboxymuconolactone decarboxylase family protein [Streptosporangium soli]|nr:carboxymuconolactone decarboxylase family protein [Streptosporangium sp. KLBMP 9127]